MKNRNYRNVNNKCDFRLLYDEMINGIVLPIYIMSCLTELFLNRFVIYRVKNLFMSIFDKVFPNDNEE